MQPKLTIAIPTYNRAEKLKECVSRVIRQSGGKPVEVLVSDNASSDQTEALMAQMSEEYEISYFRNKENIGPDRNFLSCYERAKGEYVMLLGDDDFLLPGAVDSILEALEKSPVMLYLNSSILLSENPFSYSSPLLEEQEVLDIRDRDAFFEKVGIYITFMSSMILRTDYVREIAHKEQYVGTYFIQSYIAFEVMKHDGLYCVNTKNCIAESPNETVGFDLYFVWGKQYYDLLHKAGKNAGISNEMIDRVYLHNLQTTLYDFVLGFRLACLDENKWDKSCMIACTKRYKLLHLKYLITIYCPIGIMRFLRNQKRNLRKILKR